MARKLIGKYGVAFLALIISFLLPLYYEKSWTELSMPTLRFLAFSFIVLQSAALIYRVRNKIPLSKTDNIITGVSNAFTILIYISLFFLALRFNGLSVQQFFTSISIVAAAIALVSKEYITSIISGFIISFTKIINIGDYVAIGENRGRVQDIKLSKFFLENDQGELIILNNDKVFHGDIINYSQSNKRRVHLKFELKNNQSLDMEQLESELIQSLEKYKHHIKADSYNLRVDHIMSDKIQYSFNYTLEMLETNVEKEIRKNTIRKLIRFIQTYIQEGS